MGTETASASPRAAVVADAARAALDPAYFSRQHFGWDPYPYQRDVLDAVLMHGKRRWLRSKRYVPAASSRSTGPLGQKRTAAQGASDNAA